MRGAHSAKVPQEARGAGTLLKRTVRSWIGTILPWVSEATLHKDPDLHVPKNRPTTDCFKQRYDFMRYVQKLENGLKKDKVAVGRITGISGEVMVAVEVRDH